jgi:surface antigen
MFARPGSHHPIAVRGRRLAVLAIAAVSLVLGLITAPPSQADVFQQWVPNPTGLAQTTRPCPAPAIAAYDDATCWSVAPDPSNPLDSRGDPNAWAQCTYWVLELRPDLWNDRSATDPEAYNWTAYTWATHALLEGLGVDHLPVAGAIAVWPQSSSDPNGHVAYVQSVTVDPSTGDALVTIQEFNDTTFDDPSQGQGDTMTLDMSTPALSSVQFIHQPPAPLTPPLNPVTDNTASATIATSSVARRREPRLTVSVAGGRIRAYSFSPSPMVSVLVKLPSHAAIRRLRLQPGSRSSVDVKPGRYQVCVSQTATTSWLPAHTCRFISSRTAHALRFSATETARP